MTDIELVLELCKERNWSLCELSKRSKISETTLYTWKDGQREPSNKSIKKICETCGIDLFQYYSRLNNTKFYGEMNNPHLTGEQEVMLYKWTLLNSEAKKVINNLIDLLIGKKN